MHRNKTAAALHRLDFFHLQVIWRQFVCKETRSKIKINRSRVIVGGWHFKFFSLKKTSHKKKNSLVFSNPTKWILLHSIPFLRSASPTCARIDRTLQVKQFLLHSEKKTLLPISIRSVCYSARQVIEMVSKYPPLYWCPFPSNRRLPKAARVILCCWIVSK